MLTKSQVLGASVFTFILAAAAYAASVLGYFDEAWLEVLAGFLGFGGLAGLNSYFNSASWKKYGIVILAAAGIAGLLTGVATPVMVGKWLAFWGIIGVGTTAHSAHKEIKKLQGL